MKATLDGREVFVTVTSEVYEAGRHPEDGEPIIRESYFLTATHESGLRWAHEHNFATLTLADHFMRDHCHSLEPLEWSRWLTVYGSEAWGAEDEAELQRFDEDHR